MKNVRLKTSIDFFIKEIDNILLDDEIELTREVKNDVELNKLKNRIENWENEIFILLNNSIFDPDDYFSNKLSPINISILSRIKVSNNLSQSINEKKDILIENYNKKKDFLFDFKNVLPFLDVVINERKLPTLEFSNPSEIIYLILLKLKKIKDGEYFRVDLILEGNGVELKNGIQEFFQYTEELEKNRWVDFENKYLGRITLKGELYLEKQNKFFSKKESELIAKKIDLIISKLEKLGYGQEILFDELEELKSLYSKLNKKNWSQLVKGKIIDLAISKVIDKSGIDFLSTELLGNETNLKFLKS